MESRHVVLTSTGTVNQTNLEDFFFPLCTPDGTFTVPLEGPACEEPSENTHEGEAALTAVMKQQTYFSTNGEPGAKSSTDTPLNDTSIGVDVSNLTIKQSLEQECLIRTGYQTGNKVESSFFLVATSGTAGND